MTEKLKIWFTQDVVAVPAAPGVMLSGGTTTGGITGAVHVMTAETVFCGTVESPTTIVVVPVMGSGALKLTVTVPPSAGTTLGVSVGGADPANPARYALYGGVPPVGRKVKVLPLQLVAATAPGAMESAGADGGAARPARASNPGCR